MAIDFDPDLQRWTRSIGNWRGIIRHYAAHIIVYVRRFRRSSTKASRIANLRNTPQLRTAALADWTIDGDLRRDGWAYIHPFFDLETHRALLKAWPSLINFEPPRSSLEKSYDTFSGWTNKRRDRNILVDSFLYDTFEMLFSDSTTRLVTDLAGDDIARIAANVSLSWARNGSFLLPHRDSNSQGDGSWINFVIFLEGKLPPLESGGTSFFQTNRYDQPLFVPKSLINTAIVYNTRGDFYHGFPPVTRGKFSKRIICNFASPAEVLPE